jgi:hypothetical protein
MRKAAGIMLIIFAMLLLNTVISALSGSAINIVDIIFNLFITISAALFITGGIFCLMKKYRKVCLASAWLAVFIMIMWLTGSHPYAFSWLSWVFSILGTLPIIFVYLAKKEWQEIQG